MIIQLGKFRLYLTTPLRQRRYEAVGVKCLKWVARWVRLAFGLLSLVVRHIARARLGFCQNFL